MKHEKKLVPNSHWEWERLGISFDAWKQQQAEKKKNTTPTYVIPGPGGYDYI